MAAGGWLEREAERSHRQPQTLSRESKLAVGQGYKLSKVTLPDGHTLARLYFPIPSPNICTNWVPNVQIREPVMAISRLSEHTLH